MVADRAALDCFGFAESYKSVLYGMVGCLLQNQFVNEKLAFTDEEVSRAKQQGGAEINVRLLHQKLHRSIRRRQVYMEHSFRLRRKLILISSATLIVSAAHKLQQVRRPEQQNILLLSAVARAARRVPA